jgi:hypothetical protein
MYKNTTLRVFGAGFVFGLGFWRVLELCLLDARLELLLLQCVVGALGLVAAVQAAIRIGLFDTRLLGLLFAKLIEVDDLAQLNTSPRTA